MNIFEIKEEDGIKKAVVTQEIKPEKVTTRSLSQETIELHLAAIDVSIENLQKEKSEYEDMLNSIKKDDK